MNPLAHLAADLPTPAGDVPAPSPAAPEVEATMLVGDWQTRCSVCKWGVDPSETHHLTVLPGYSNNAPTEGCGARFVAMSPDFSARVMPGVKPCGHVADIRPDLPVTDLWPMS